MRPKSLLLTVFTLCLLCIAISPASGDTDTRAEAILDDIAEARHPEGLSSFTCRAEMETGVEGGGNIGAGFLALLEMPVIGMDITYIAPFDFRVEIENSPIPGVDAISDLRLRGDDPLTLSNPALKQSLLAVYDVEYTGRVSHDGAPCVVLHFTPKDETAYRPPFGLYIRESDNVPVYTEMILTHEDENILFRSEIEYTTIDGFMLPGVIETRAEFLNGTELVMTTRFTDYVVNEVKTAISEEEDNGWKHPDNSWDVDDDAFTDLYRGFEETVMMVNLSEDSEPYRKLRFAFTLEVESKEVAKELDLKHPDIVADVRDALSGRGWASLEDRRYEVGRELMARINDILLEGEVTDFYFTVFMPER